MSIGIRKVLVPLPQSDQVVPSSLHEMYWQKKNQAQNVIAYKNNQATSQANACGNDFFPTNIGCQNTGSQIQGDENSVALAAQQTFPPEEIIPIPPDNGPTPAECEACLAPLLANGQIAIDLAEDLGLGVFATAVI